MEWLVGLIPFALIALCPLLMFFMMRGKHGGHGNNDHAAHQRSTSAQEVARLRDEVAGLRARLDEKENDAAVGRRAS